MSKLILQTPRVDQSRWGTIIVLHAFRFLQELQLAVRFIAFMADPTYIALWTHSRRHRTASPLSLLSLTGKTGITWKPT